MDERPCTSVRPMSTSRSACATPAVIVNPTTNNSDDCALEASGNL